MLQSRKSHEARNKASTKIGLEAEAKQSQHIVIFAVCASADAYKKLKTTSNLSPSYSASLSQVKPQKA